MADKLDLRRRLAAILGMCGSVHAGERANAAEAADRLIRAAGMDWADFVASAQRAEVAEEAARHLLAEIDLLRADRAEAEANGGTLTLWQDVGPDISRQRRIAAWLVGLNSREMAWLSPREFDFLSITVPVWRGKLLPKQQAWLQHIVDRTVRSTGQTPPP